MANSRMSKKPKTLPAFSAPELSKAHVLLATTVALMMGRKFEEDDWGRIYCDAKAIPRTGWSNLNIDVMHEGLAVEHKMLGRRSGDEMRQCCGTRLMHPAATRSIRIPLEETDPNRTMQIILGQYADLIESRRKKVLASSGGTSVDMRTGWLLWQPSLVEFLYFEEELLPPNPKDFFAEWRESKGGTRKASKNLWVFEKDTGSKRYSITTSAGPKIQPYFDVPPPSDPNLYYFRVQGEILDTSAVRIWLTPSTARELESLVGKLTTENLASFINRAAEIQLTVAPEESSQQDMACPLILSTECYENLRKAFGGVSDEHAVQLLLRFIRSHQPRTL